MPNNAVQERRRRVFAAWTQGATQLALAEQEGISQSQISRDIAAVCAMLAPVDWREVDKNRQELLGRITYAESEMLAAWERSKLPKQRDKQKQSSGRGKGRLDDVEVVREGRDGNPRFIERLESLWMLRARLVGAIQNTITEQLAQQLAALEKAAREHGHAI
jgi:hypothetical protein